MRTRVEELEIDHAGERGEREPEGEREGREGGGIGDGEEDEEEREEEDEGGWQPTRDGEESKGGYNVGTLESMAAVASAAAMATKPSPAVAAEC